MELASASRPGQARRITDAVFRPRLLWKQEGASCCVVGCPAARSSSTPSTTLMCCARCDPLPGSFWRWPVAPESMGHVQRQVHRQNPAYNCLRAGHQLRPQLGREQAVRFWIWKLVMRTLGLRRMMLDAAKFKEVRSFNARQPGGFLG